MHGITDTEHGCGRFANKSADWDSWLLTLGISGEPVNKDDIWYGG